MGIGVDLGPKALSETGELVRPTEPLVKPQVMAASRDLCGRFCPQLRPVQFVGNSARVVLIAI
jgi:hypothetical protein